MENNRTLLKQLLHKLAQQKDRKATDIAIIGVSGRYPMADTLDQFWEKLKNGESCISEIPKERWDWQAHYDGSGQNGKSYTRWGGFISAADAFDPLFFQMSPREAEEIDPQERVFLETAWSVLEDAGITGKALAKANRKVGVFVGVMNHYYTRLGGTSAYWSIANRVSYCLDLQGPSMAVDTACSSSLTAIHLACESLRNRECELAIAGGVNLIVHPDHYGNLCKMNMLSKKGECRAFGEGADGFVDGEGVGAVLLKPLDQAVADNDQIYAVIKNSAINAGGKTSGYTVPNPSAQAEVIRSALREAGIDPETISYVEAHGTGTSLGDPIEIAGLTNAFGTEKKRYCSIGSVKTNIGHLESAAGVAGLTKVLLQMKHKQLVPSLHAQTTNPHISFEDTPFYVQSEWEEWTKQPTTLPRRACISSFGAGGANAHLIVEEYEREPMGEPIEQDAPQLIVLSAKSEERLAVYAQQLLDFLVANTSKTGRAAKGALHFSHIAYTLQSGREEMPERLAFVAESMEDCLEKLRMYCHGERKHCYRGRVSNRTTTDRTEAASPVPVDDWDSIARLWVSGTEIDWERLHPSPCKRRVSLPTYPFARERYWISEAVEKGEKLHPLLDANTSTLKEQKFTLRLDKREFYTADHQIAGEHVMPAAVLLEMAMAASTYSLDRPVRHLKQVRWIRPIVAPELVHISLFHEEDAVVFQIWTEQEQGARIVHADGRLAHESQGATGFWGSVSSGADDLKEIESRCRQEIQVDELYRFFEEAGISYGPSFTTISRVARSDAEAFSMIELPPGLKHDFANYTVHPALLDGALQTVAALLMEENGGEIPACVPVSVSEIKLHGPLTKRCVVHVKRLDRATSHAKEQCFAIWIYNEQGEALVELHEFMVAPIDFYGNKANGSELLYFSPEWEPSVADVADWNGTIAGNMLLFDTTDDLQQVLQETWNKSAHPSGKIIFVKPGASYRQKDACSYEINPEEPKDYQELMASLQRQQLAPSCILHNWSKISSSHEAEAIETELRMGLYSLVHLVRSLHAQKELDRVQLVYVCHQEGECRQPAYGAMAGWIRSVVQESARLKAKVVELQDCSHSPSELAVLLCNEFHQETWANEQVRYVGKQRYINALQVVDPPNYREDNIALRQHGVYLITGGLGGVGLAIARYLAKHVQARLVLCGRSVLQPIQQRQLEELEAAGAEVLYLPADVSRPDDVQKLIGLANARFQRIDGIFHSAGVHRDALFTSKTVEEIKEVLLPKVHGALCLDHATKTEQLDFFVLFSSLAAVIGNPGQSDYAYANSFLDQFAFWRESLVQKGARTGKTVSINWPLWQDGGMTMDAKSQAWWRATSGLTPLTIEQGWVALLDSLRMETSQMVVVAGDRQRTVNMFRQTKAESSPATHLSADSEVAEEDLREKAITILKSVLTKETKLAANRIEPDEPLEKYGVNSVMIMQMIRELEVSFGELPKTLFFEYQTIAEAAGYLVRHHAGKLAEIAGLSPTKADAQRVIHTQQQHRAGECLAEAAGVGEWLLPGQSRFARSDPAAATSSREIAIVGISGRYPQADTLEELWERLRAGTDCITEIPGERWDHTMFFDPNRDQKGKSYSKWGGFIRDVDKFDPLFFNISPREAKLLDPQERLFLQTAWETIEDGGYTRQQLDKQKVGVFVGVMYGQYQLLGAEELLKGNAIAPHSSFASIANRVSYFFNFSGPSIALDTMCSSSLTALHLACASIQRGECDLAIAGGVNVTIHPAKYLQLCDANFASSDGRCRSFGEGGDGYVPGEGVGAVLLKPLSKALRDGDHVYAVIKGTAINHGGKTNGYTVPNPNAQAEVIARALQDANVDPAQVSYVEAHGTGTSLGDPIEIAGLMKAYGAQTDKKQFCSIGSIKSNIGHLESAAGIAGITKIILQMKHKQLVPSLHAGRLNPHIPFHDSPFYVQRELTEWKQAPRIAAISSFGAGGANAHVILEEFDSAAIASVNNQQTPQIIVLSAKNEERLKEYARKLLAFLAKEQAADNTFLPEQAVSEEEIRQILIDLIAQMVKVEDREVNVDEDFTAFGLDPVHLAQISQHFQHHYQMDLSLELFSQYETIARLAEYVVKQYASGLAARTCGQNEEKLRLSDIAFTLQTGREAMEERLAFVVSSVSELRDRLREFCQRKGEQGMMHRGNAANAQGVAKLLYGDEMMSEFVQRWIKHGQLSKLAEGWCHGVEVNWSALWTEQSAKRISLPTYPFARERCWVTTTSQEALAGTAALHPLLDRIDPSLCLEYKGLGFRKTFSAADSVLQDHQVLGTSFLPGVAQLEMVRAAYALNGPGAGFTLRNVFWLKPFTVEQAVKELEVILAKEGENLRFTVQHSRNGHPEIHARGEIRRQEPGYRTQTERLSIEEIKERCRTSFSGQDLYRLFREGGIGYGPTFQTVDQLWASELEALSLLSLPSEQATGFSRYVLHPPLLDGALQTIAGIALTRNGQENPLMLPYSVGSVQWLHPLGTRMYAYVQAAGRDLYHLSILDENGMVCVSLRDLAIRSFAQPVKKANRAAGNMHAEMKEFFYQPVWKEEPLPSEIPDRPVAAAEKALIIYPEQSLGMEQALATVFADRQVAMIRLGNETKRHSEDFWEIKSDDPNAFQTCLHQLNGLRTIYFLGGIEVSELDGNDRVRLEKSQETGVISLFRLLQALSRQGYAAKPITLKVVTNNTLRILPDERTIPYAASLHGLAKSAAKEFASWKISCIDVDLPVDRKRLTDAERTAMAAVLQREPADPRGNEVAIRAGKRYVRICKPLQLGPVEQIPFVTEGVYLIVGGAGGIGLEMSRYLARQVHARLILVGRSPLTKTQQAKIAEIEAIGGKVLYLQADVTDLASITAAIQRGKAKFGRINGVIHSAIVLRDRSIDNMDESTFRAALEPKVTGSVMLHQALQGESLDFMLFFSSAQSFTGNAGQSNYAAACAFKDAFAQFLNQTQTYPVKIINWGYWGEVGVVASDAYKRRLAAQGIYSIEPAEGMEAVRRIMAHPSEQIMAIKADMRVLRAIGVDTDGRLQEAEEEVPTPLSHLLPVDQQPLMDHRTFSATLEAFEQVQSWSMDLLFHAFQALGVFQRPGEQHERLALRERLAIIPNYFRLFDVLLDLLQQGGYLQQKDDRILTCKKGERPVYPVEPSALEEHQRELLSAYPEMGAHIRLLSTCLASYPQILRGEAAATDVMFPDSSMELVEPIYQKNVTADYFNQLVVWSLLRRMEDCLTRLPSGETFNILEVGAGTGGTSAAVFPAIHKFADRIRYVYTDVSSSFTLYGKKQYGEANPYAEFKRLNIEQDLDGQDIQFSHFDVVLATNVLHATRDLQYTLGNIKALLKPGGWLILNEATGANAFTSLTFGLLEGWWLYKDEQFRLPGTPLASAEMWEQLLREAGFGQAVILGRMEERGKTLNQNVMIAQNETVSDPFPQSSSRGSLDKDKERPIAPVVNALFVPTEEAELIEGIEAKVMDLLERILEVKRQDLQTDKPFSEYGVDSITGLTLVKAINEEFSLTLKTTVLFDYSNIKQLSAFIRDQLRSNDVHTAPRALAPLLSPGEAAVSVENQAPEAYETTQWIEDTIAGLVAASIEARADQIMREKPFFEYGVDSIVGLDLIKKINDAFGITLKTTALFDYGTIKELSRHIHASYGEKRAARAPDADDRNLELLDRLVDGQYSVDEVYQMMGWSE